MQTEPAPHILVGGLSFPEAPRWRPDGLWFSDFYTHRVQSVGADGQLQTRATVPNRPSGLGFTAAGDLLVVSMLDRRLLRIGPQGAAVVAELGRLAQGPCNDMVVAPSGRAYVGNFGYDKNNGEAFRTSCVLKVDADGRVDTAADGLSFPNGMVITADARTLVVAETFAGRLTAFDMDARGDLSGRRVFAAIENCHPDGLCLDAEGAIWVADAQGNRVLRVFDGGRIDRVVSTGSRGAYACALGGADGRTLFICTNTGAGHGMAEKREGDIRCMRVDVPAGGSP